MKKVQKNELIREDIMYSSKIFIIRLYATREPEGHAIANVKYDTDKTGKIINLHFPFRKFQSMFIETTFHKIVDVPMRSIIVRTKVHSSRNKHKETFNSTNYCPNTYLSASMVNLCSGCRKRILSTFSRKIGALNAEQMYIQFSS